VGGDYLRRLYWLQRLYTQSGQAELGITLLQQLIKESDNPVAIKEMKERIRVLEQKVKNSKTSP
jgi:hypothetical protein